MTTTNTPHDAADLALARIGLECMVDFMAAELGTDRTTAFAAMRANADSPKMRELLRLTSAALAEAAAGTPTDQIPAAVLATA